MYNTPLAYFITFRTYGTWLHGDERGSVDRRYRNTFDTPVMTPRAGLQKYEMAEMSDAPLVLNDEQRLCVRDAIESVCSFKGWNVHAINVRSNHVHLVVSAELPPERVMNTLKAWCTRRLREAGLVSAEARVWSRHGSTIYLFRTENLREKIEYVLNQQ